MLLVSYSLDLLYAAETAIITADVSLDHHTLVRFGYSLGQSLQATLYGLTFDVPSQKRSVQWYVCCSSTACASTNILPSTKVISAGILQHMWFLYKIYSIRLLVYWQQCDYIPKELH